MYVNDAFSRCLRLHLWGGGWGLFFPVLLPRGGVGGCAIIQSGGVSKKLIPILRTLLRKSDPTSQCTNCYMLCNIQEEAVFSEITWEISEGKKV